MDIVYTISFMTMITFVASEVIKIIRKRKENPSKGALRLGRQIARTEILSSVNRLIELTEPENKIFIFESFMKDFRTLIASRMPKEIEDNGKIG